MWVGAHISSSDKKVIRANISSTDNQRIENIFVIIVNMRKIIPKCLIIEVTRFHTLWKFVLNDLVHFKVWYKYQWSSKLNRGCFKDAQKDWWIFLKINAPYPMGATESDTSLVNGNSGRNSFLCLNIFMWSHQWKA